eukprot:6185597-Alexandrium_andersonii.AAC.1
MCWPGSRASALAGAVATRASRALRTLAQRCSPLSTTCARAPRPSARRSCWATPCAEMRLSCLSGPMPALLTSAPAAVARGAPG